MSGSAICSAEPVSAASVEEPAAANCLMETASWLQVLARSRYPATMRRASSPLGGLAVEGFPSEFKVRATSATLSTAARHGLLFWLSRAEATNAARLPLSRRGCARFFQ